MDEKVQPQDLAGFLYYPVAIIACASLLLISVGVFIKLSDSVKLDDVPVNTSETLS